MTVLSVRRGRRHLPKRLRLNCRGVRAPSAREIDEAIAQVRRSGVVDVLAVRLRRRRDADARLSLLGYEVAITLHGYTKGHRMVLVEIVRLVNSLQSHTWDLLRMPNWTYVGCYDRFQRLRSRVSAALDEGRQHVDQQTGEVVRIDSDWYRTQVIRAAVPAELVRGCALAVDGTAMESWGRLHGDAQSIVPDGEPAVGDEEA